MTRSNIGVFADRIFAKLESIKSTEKYINRVQRYMFFRHARRLRARIGQQFAVESGMRIKAGVFEGLQLTQGQSWGNDLYSVITGSYECELMDIIKMEISKNPSLIIDIGCADGLYAVGLATLTDVDVFAYDISAAAREVTMQNAALNGVAERVHVRGEATPHGLDELLSNCEDALLICDIEGGEIDLIDPMRCEGLVKCNMLIEVHDQQDYTSDVITSRFERTHKATLISRSPRSAFGSNDLRLDSEDEAWMTISEGRSYIRNNWLLLER